MYKGYLKRLAAKVLFLTFAFISAFTLLFIASHGEAAEPDSLRVEFSNLAKVLMWEKAPSAFSEKGVALYSGKEKICSAERWAEILVKLDSSTNPLADTLLFVTLSGVYPWDEPLVLKKSPVESESALVRIDMRSLKSEHVKLRVEWKDSGQRLLGMGETWVSAETVKPLETGLRIPVRIDVPEGTDLPANYPVRFGVPMPRGALWEEDGLKIIDSEGRELASQLEIAGRWAEEGSVKWMWVDTLVSGSGPIFVETGERTRASLPVNPIRMSRIEELIAVDTGVAEYVVGACGSLVKEASYGGLTVAREGRARGLYVVDRHGRLGKACQEGSSLKVESEGPVSAVIRIEGFYSTEAGEKLARHITRLHFFSGRAEVAVTHTLILTRDTNDIWFTDIGWEFEVEPGGDAKALFGISSEKPEENLVVELPDGKVLSMLQEEGVNLGLRPTRLRYWNRSADRLSTPWELHFYGNSRFILSKEGEGFFHEGEDMGDWAAVKGKGGGWMVSCRDSAAQHPKEFKISRNFLNLKLFSSSSGKELDFRMESIMKNWGLLPIENMDLYSEVPHDVLEENIKVMGGHSSNAVGWAKTHEILLAPFKNETDPGRQSFLHSKQIFAHTDPSWIWKTRVLGALYPRDTEGFPLEETLIEKTFWGMVRQGLGEPKGGFVDYRSGPVWIIHDFRGGSYTIRSASWYLYARSADRRIREFAQGVNRAFLDNNIAHWDSDEKAMGLILNNVPCAGTQRRRTRKSDLPLYWEGVSRDSRLSTACNLDQALIDYYLTGYRRAGDIMENFTRTVKENLTVETRHWRVISVMRHLSQAYELTWEPRLRELIYELTEHHLYDRESGVLLTKARPHASSTYKVETDVDTLISLWNLFGDGLFRDMAKASGRHVWETVGLLEYRTTGMPGHFIWEETRCPSVASSFDFARRRLIADYLIGGVDGDVRLDCVSRIPRFFRGLPHAMDILTRTSESLKADTSWIAFSTEQAPVSVFFSKPEEGGFTKGETTLKVDVMTEDILPPRKENDVEKPLSAGGTVVLKPHATVANRIWVGHDLHTINERSSNRFGKGGLVTVIIPKDAPPGLYELEVTRAGTFIVFLNEPAPLALYAPEGWKPPVMNPPVRTYFLTNRKVSAPRMFFEKEVFLFNPEGESFNGAGKVSGWVDIPVDTAGLWSFESIDPGMVKTENIEPFFSMGSPKFFLSE